MDTAKNIPARFPENLRDSKSRKVKTSGASNGSRRRILKSVLPHLFEVPGGNAIIRRMLEKIPCDPFARRVERKVPGLKCGDCPSLAARPGAFRSETLIGIAAKRLAGLRIELVDVIDGPLGLEVVCERLVDMGADDVPQRRIAALLPRPNQQR
jgi:hypothetical protein